MGYGSYSYAAHQALTTARVSQPRQRVFQQRSCHPLMNPRGIAVRESRDSTDNPSSLAIAFALDVTGSMGSIPEALAKRELPGFMLLLQQFGISDPQLLFMAVGDAVGDQAPLQVGQFESTAALMDQWLTWSWLEGGGGAGEYESYELAMYFAAQHLSMDCLEKRQQRGYFFMTGDEKPFPRLSRHTVHEVCGDSIDFDPPTRAIVEDLQQSMEPFFLIPDLSRRSSAERTWRDLIGDRVICLEHADDTCMVAAALVALNEGLLTLDGVARQVAAHAPERVGRIARALMPFAASLGRDDAPPLRPDPRTTPGNESTRTSQMKRISS